MSNRTILTVVISLAVLAVGQAAFSYPTSVNVIPTADILDLGSTRLEYENDGYPRIGKGDSISYGFAQFGLTPRVEIGVDQWDISGEPQNAFNGKLLLAEESKFTPALAAGVMDIAEGSRSSGYAVGMKSFGAFRLHLGYIDAEYSKGLMAGCDQELSEGTYLLADWLPGDENFLAFGLYKEFAKRWAATLTYGFPNQSGGDNLTAVNISYTLPLLGK
ncbi:MAG: hypothetical protein Q7T82_00670 [Armatimonadota bacterium]|nr:hypothetical protein [Armatimonadota bacterium]